MSPLYLNVPIGGSYCAYYRVAVGILDVSSMPPLYLNVPIGGWYCAYYRVAVGILGMSYMPPLYLNVSISGKYFTQLPRSGWSFGRAGLGARATYPA